MDWAEACRILGVKETASDAEIHDQYIYKANLLHRDKTLHLPETMRDKAEQELKLINQAHDFLSKPVNNPFSNPPKLDIKPKHIRFTDVEVGQKKSTTLEICSIGGPYDNIWIDNQLPEWLSIVSFKSTTNELLPAQVAVQATGIGEPDTKFSFDLLVRLENQKTTLKTEEKVRIELWTKAEPALLTAYPTKFENEEIQAGDTKTRTFRITNPGRGQLKGKITTSKPWVSVEPNIINIPPSGQQEYTVTVITFTLSGGFEDNDFIRLDSNAGNYSIPINISVVDFDIDEPSEIQTQPEIEQVQAVDFSLKEFWHTLGLFVKWPIYLIIITIPLGIWLFGQSVAGAWSLLVTYGVVAFVVAFIRGNSKGRKESLIYRQQKNTATATKPRDIFAPSIKATGSRWVYVSKSTGYFHRDGCKLVPQSSSRNISKITRDQAIIHGYKPCAVCRP